MKLIPLPLETRAATGYTHKVIMTYEDITAAAGSSDTTVTIQIFPYSSGTTPAGTVVTKAGFNLVTPFDASDSSINSLLLEVGDGGDTDRLIPQKQLAVDGTEILYFETANVTDTLPYAYLAADGIDAKFTVAGGGDPTLDELNAGEVEIYLGIYDLNDLEKVGR